MKRFYTLAFITCLLSFTGFAQNRPVNTLTAWWGNWSSSSNWSLERVPQNGDSVVIPQGKGVVLNKEADYSNLYIKIYGTLQVKKQLKLDAQSIIEVDITGLINPFAANRKKEIIVLDGKNKYDENAQYSITGPSVASAKTGIAPNGFAIMANTLPVHFTSFYVTGTEKAVQVKWTTADEINNSHFEIEKSIDGSNWKKLAVVLGAVTTTNNSYSYTDKDITGSVMYYRIRQVDVNGSFQYTSVRKVSFDKIVPVTNIYASSKQTVTIDFNSARKENLQVQVVNMNGQVIAGANFKQAAYKINMPVNVTPGVYVVKVSDANGWNEVKKILL